MIPFKIKSSSIFKRSKTFKIPSSFFDITMNDLGFYSEHSKEPVKVAERLTGLPNDVLNEIDVTPIAEVLEFMSEPLNEIEPSRLINFDGKDYLLPDDINQKSWYQKIEAVKAYQNGERSKLIAIYLQPIMSRKVKPKDKKIELVSTQFGGFSVYDFFKAYNYLELQILEIIENENNMPHPKTTPEQIEAGAESFNVLGVFNSVDNLAKAYSKDHDQILMWSYSRIFNILYKNNITAIFDINYSRIMTRKANQ